MREDEREPGTTGPGGPTSGARSECKGGDFLQRFADDQLDEYLTQWAIYHLSECERCQQAFSRIRAKGREES